MSVVKSTSQEIPTSSSSTPEFIGQMGPTLLKDERTWKAYLASSDAGTSSSILHVNGEDISVGSLGFLYDYYGMTEETLQEPPSPGTSISSPAPSTTSSEVILDVLKRVTTASAEKQEQRKSSNEEKQKSIIPASIAPKSSGITITAVSEAPILTISGGIGTLVKAEQRQGSCSPEVPPEMVNVDPDATVVTGSESYTTHQITHIAPLSVVPVTDNKSGVPTQEGVIINHFPAQKTVFQSEERYICILEAPTSIIQKRGEESLTYLNKGQFYKITFEFKAQPNETHHPKMKSIVHLLFSDEKDPRNELAHWQYWHAQQPNPNQKAFDIDRNKCQNIEKFDEVGYNAVGFIWCSQLKAKIVLRMNCLSTDFSPQKGVKGIPLQLQIDTYEHYHTREAEVVHRALCQIKIFRDKGAERKNKDESKTAEKRMIKYMKQNSGSGVPVCSGVPVSHVSSLFQGPSKVTKLTSTTPLGPKPVVFVPKNEGSYSDDSSSIITLASASPPFASPTFLDQLRDRESKRTLTEALTEAKDDFEDLSVQIPKYKTARVTKRKAPAVTIYVRKEEEKIYNALMLEELTVDDLKHAVAMKYGMPFEMIKNVYKKTRKGILVNLDDQMVEQYVDEDDFIIQVNFDNQLGHFELTLIY